MKMKSEAFRNWLMGGSDPLEEEMLETLKDADDSHKDEASWKEPEVFKPYRRSLRDVLIEKGYYRSFYVALSVVLCVVLIALLLATVMDMPYFGQADTLMDSEVSEFYVENTLEDTGAVNVISGIILNYRGFDTLGEAHVLFIAVCSVIILLRMPKEDALSAYHIDREAEKPENDDILFAGARVLVPLIILFGVYIILNGNISPGGGFSGGAVIGAGLILCVAVYGFERMRRFFNYNTFRTLSVLALISYTSAKTFHFITGANDLHVHIPTGTPGTIFSGGLLLPLNIFVGVVVACTMYALFSMFRKGDF